jgi:hypothetical protein
MNKDVIYIDVDDDVTAIIGKIKNAKEKIVALVPPKRAGALQSAVNLRLIERMAKAEKKSLVLVTNNQALVALAANASIPVAKNLQSKPEIAEIPALAVDDGDDIIDGADLPVGDHARSVPVKDSTRSTSTRSDAVDTLDIDGEEVAAATAASTGAATAKKAAEGRGKVKIPNFDKFRKRLFFGIGGGVLLAALLVWMFVFAPAATVVVTAKTTPAPVSSTIRLVTTEATDFEEGIVKSSTQELKKQESVEFDATGEADKGEKATGTVRFSTNSISALGRTIPAGTVLTASGDSFTTDQSVTITFENYQGADVGITAQSSGTAANGANGSMSGAPSGINATLVGSTTGGTTRVVKVVSAEDIERARGQLIGENTDDAKKDLVALFKNGEKVIDSSFTVNRADAVATPAVDEEAPASGKAKLSIETTYRIYALPKSDLENYLKSSLEEQIDDADTQRIYNTGADDAGLSNFRTEDDAVTATLTASGQIGPKIDEAVIKDKVKGKIFGDVQSTLQEIEGVEDVDVKFSFFWVRTVPNNPDKISIEFQLQDE